ncbi:MAG: LruC domain-containing protein [Sphaerochaeta sp.]|nr:LruC domain-containing protein [Sphaerochaeta sp.]
MVFPNASYGSGNKQYLESGDTVYIGKIPKDYSLGFVLIANGWSSASSQVRREGQGIYYSQKDLNPDGEDHASIIYHSGEKIFLVGMEDNKHTATDYNFRDVIFAVVVGDETLVKNLPAVTSDSNLDGDGDGVIDVLDAYPDNPLRTTTETLSGTIAYEDLWPKLGDYDFNDLVIGYEYTIDGNKDNEIVSMNMQYTLKASGAGYPNGLALALPLKNTDFEVSDIAYSDSTIDPEDTDITVISEGEDSKRSQILIFKKQKSVMSEKTFNIDYTTYPKLRPESVSFTLTFTDPIAKGALGKVPYDVFMLVDNAESDTDENKWGREVHLLGYGPTSKANPTFLAEADALKNKDYYKSENNLPWAIHIPGDWDHTLEKKSIVDGYKNFGAWAESGGKSYPDWYLDKPNYRNRANLY